MNIHARSNKTNREDSKQMPDKSIKITLEWLQGKSACGEGQRWFKKHFPEGGEITDVLILVTQDPDANDRWVQWPMGHAKYKEAGWVEGLQISGSLCLSGCTLPDGLKLPDTVGGYLCLSGTNLEKKNVPAHLRDKVVL